MRQRKVVFAHVKDVQNQVDYVKKYGDIVSDSSCVRQCMCFWVYIVKQIYNVWHYICTYICILCMYMWVLTIYIKYSNLILGEACQFVDCHLIHISCFWNHLPCQNFTIHLIGPCAAAVDRHPHRSMPKPPQSDGTSSASDFLRWTLWRTASDIWQPKLLQIIYIICIYIYNVSVWCIE